MIPRPLTMGEPARVLLVEDEVLLRNLVAEELRACGCRVIEAGRADEAIAYLEAGGGADLVFSDVQLPGAANGVDLARRLRELDGTLPVFLTSATATPGDAKGDWRFIPKPYDIPRLVDDILAALGLAPPEAGA
jgi:CheY-like chemotaxis protein